MGGSDVKLWLLERLPSEKVWYEEMIGMVIAAETAGEARLLAASECGDEGEEAWMNPTRTTCEELIPGSDARVVLTDFKAG